VGDFAYTRDGSRYLIGCHKLSIIEISYPDEMFAHDDKLPSNPGRYST